MIMKINELAKQIHEAAQPYLDWYEDENREGDGLKEAEDFSQSVANALVSIAEDFGFDVMKSYDAISTYFSIYDDSEDEEFVCEIRASNHQQKYSGPIWSFTIQDDIKTNELGLKKINEELQDRAEDLDYGEN